MRLATRVVAAGLLAVLPACSAQSQQTDDVRAENEAVRLAVSVPGERIDPATAPVLVVDSAGAMTLDGSVIAPDAVVDRLVALSGEGRSNLLLEADGSAPFVKILPILKRIDAAPGQQLQPASFEPLRDFGQRERNGELPGEGETFRGDPDTYELPVWVSFDDGTGHCVVTLGGMMLDSAGLYDRSFQILDNWVQDAGGVDAFMNEEAFSTLRATIQSPAATPWRSIAGASYAAIVSGYPEIQLEMIAQ